MAVNGTAWVLSLLLTCLRMVAAVLALLLLTFAIRGETLSLDRLASVPRDLSAVITASAEEPPNTAAPGGRARLRRQLQELFAHHATLVVRLMRSTVSEGPAFVDDAAVLIRNSDDLEVALSRIVDPDDAEAFARGWQAQTQSLFGYAAAIRDDDAAAQQEAGSELAAFVDEQATLLTEATDGRVERDVVTTALRMQIDLLRFQIDAYARADYDQAYELEREAYTHMYPFAANLAAAAAGHPEGAVRTRPLEELTARLSSLIGMHVELSVDALRAGAEGADEFPAATKALDANNRELSATLDGLLATRPSRRLSALWADQTDLLLRYAGAVADDDPSVRREVRDRLRTTSTRVERILRTVATGDGDPAAAADALHAQQKLLINQLNAYVIDNHQGAQDTAYSAHHRVPDLAHALAKILVGGLPRGGAQTGGGGIALGG